MDWRPCRRAINFVHERVRKKTRFFLPSRYYELWCKVFLGRCQDPIGHVVLCRWRQLTWLCITIRLGSVRLRRKVGRNGIATFAAFRMFSTRKSRFRKKNPTVKFGALACRVSKSASSYFSLIFSRLFSPLACIAIFNPLRDGLQPSLHHNICSLCTNSICSRLNYCSQLLFSYGNNLVPRLFPLVE